MITNKASSISLVVLCVIELTATWLYSQEKSDQLFPFFSEGNGLMGYTNANGKIVIAPRFLNASEKWGDGFAWVDLEWGTNSVDCVICDELERTGDFIDMHGNRLVNKHIHSLVGEPWVIGWEPRFEHGLALVRFPDDTIIAITTNGTPIDAHKQIGPFVQYSFGVAHYKFFEDGSVKVKLKSGEFGLLSTNGTVTLLPTNSYPNISQQ